MVLHIEEGFLEGVFCLLRRTFCSGGGILRRFFGLADLLRIVPLDTLLLQIPGDRVRGGQPRIVMERLLVEEIGVCLNRGVFRLYRVPPGLHAVLTDSGTNAARRTSHTMLRQFLTLVSGLHAHIFMFHLADLPVGGGL